MRARLLTFASLALAGTFAAGCGGGSGGSSRKAQGAAASTSGTVSKPTSGSINGNGSGIISIVPQGALVIESVAQVASQTEQAMKPGPVVGLAFKLAGSGSPLVMSELSLTNSGTMDESLLGEARLYEDKNGNAEVDTSDVLLGTAARVAQNDAAYVFTGMTAAINTGTRPQYVVAVDTAPLGSLASVSYVGSTLSLSIAANTALRADDAANRAVTPTGSFPISASVVLEVNDTALLSEVACGGGSANTSSEFFEIFNATGKPIDLKDYYLTDATDDPTLGVFYYNLPTGMNFGPTVASDFFVRFPPHTLAPGGNVVVAVDAVGFKAAFGKDATFCLRNKGTTTSVQMLTKSGTGATMTWVATPVSTTVGLTGPSGGAMGGGESVFLFTWDGVSDLVKDVDLLNYGSGSLQNNAVDKSPNQRTTGGGNLAPDVRVDSAFDTDTTASTYLRDYWVSAPVVSGQPRQPDQSNRRAAMAQSMIRVDFTEGDEVKTGGNGLTGNNETSERFGDGQGGTGTFQPRTVGTPGVVGTP